MLTSEPIPTAILMVIFGILLASCVLLKRSLDRLGIPAVLLFLVLGMLSGSEGLIGIPFDDYHLAFRLGSIALVLILFDGGLNTSTRAVKKAASPACVLATIGVVLTAGLTALFARLLGLSWPVSLLLGAVVSSTDAATVFAVLRGSSIHLKERIGSTLEVESGLNDPMAVILTFTITEALMAGRVDPIHLAWSIPLQFVIGIGVGFGLGYGSRWLLNRVQVTTAGLYPILTVAIAFLCFGVATFLQGSGFMAVYIAAIIIGNGPLPARSGLARVHDAVAWLCQIGMFLMLGLLVVPSELIKIAGVGFGMAFLLTVFARPLAVILCMTPFRRPWRETIYLGWVGLRGAVPIILASYPVLAGVQGGDRVFNIVFFIVVFNSIIPGSTIRTLTRRWGFETEQKPTPAAVLEINSSRVLNGQLLSFFIDPAVAVCGATFSQVHFPPGASAVLLIRGDTIMACRGGTRMQAGDHVYVFCQDEDRPFIELLFGQPQ